MSGSSAAAREDLVAADDDRAVVERRRGMKIVHRSSCERSAWSITPVSAISSRPVSRSRTIRAPWPSRDRMPAALATSIATCSIARCSAGAKSQPNEPDPADALERPAELRLEHDDEREQADDGARLEQLGEQPQAEELGQGVDAEQDRHADDERDRARPRIRLNSQ